VRFTRAGTERISMGASVAPVRRFGSKSGFTMSGSAVSRTAMSTDSGRTVIRATSASSSASERRHHASQSVCTFRQTRLTVSPDQVRGRLFETAPLNSAANARRTRGVLVPDR